MGRRTALGDLFAAKRHQKKAAGFVPATADAALRDTLQFGDFLLAVAAEVAHFDDFGQFSVDGLECQEGIVSAQYGPPGGQIVDRQRLIIQLDMGCTAAAMASARHPRLVDDDIAHRLGGIGEEMLAVGEVDLAGANHVEEVLVHQLGGIHVVRPPLGV